MTNWIWSGEDPSQNYFFSDPNNWGQEISCQKSLPAIR